MASGPIYFFQRASTTITDAPAADIEAEKARIAAAQEKAAEQLNALADKVRAEAGDETAILFETHAMFVEDDDYMECMMNALEERHCTAERAVQLAGEEFAAMLAAMAEYGGRQVYIDGETGQVAIEPDEITLASFQSKQEEQQKLKELMETMKGQKDVTLDGREMMVYYNIGSPEDVSAVLSNDG